VLVITRGSTVLSNEPCYYYRGVGLQNGLSVEIDDPVRTAAGFVLSDSRLFTEGKKADMINGRHDSAEMQRRYDHLAGVPAHPNDRNCD
jgi:hypothetical protein